MSLETAPTSGSAPFSRPVIARRLAGAFAVVGLAAFGMCSTLLVMLSSVADTMKSMRQGEAAMRDSLSLATAVREQYIHQAHTIIVGDREHLDHYEEWVRRVKAHAGALEGQVPPSDLALVKKVKQESQELDRLFKADLLPALDRGERASVERVHLKVEKISVSASANADAIAALAEQRMSAWHDAATEASRVGQFAGFGGMLVVILLSAVYTVRIRNSVVRPLESLAAAAKRFGEGRFESRVDRIGDGEFAAVAHAFDRMAREIAAREARLMRTERMAAIGQLAAGVAHEINNPIGVIRGYLRTMTPNDDPETLREELRILDDEAAACQLIADDLLAYARASELTTEQLEMDQLLSEAVRRFADSGEGGDVGVELDVQPGNVEGDPRRIRQVVLNLLRNAVQASGEGSQVEVNGAPRSGGGYQITIMDRGPGVAEADRDRIFEPFFTKRDAGSGLGLAVCQGIVRAHGGEIEVEERLGGGTIFTVTLPSAPPVSRRPT